MLAMHARGMGWEMTRGFLFGGMFLAAIIFAVLFSLWKWLAPDLGFSNAGQHGWQVLAVSLTLAAAYSASEARSAHVFAGKLSPLAAKARMDLAKGLAEMNELTVTAAYELPEYEDEGVGFFLQLADGRVLYVQGQDLYVHAHDAEDEEEPDKPKIFPAKRIRYCFAPASKLRLAIEPAGAYLAPDPLEAKRFRNPEESPEDGLFYNGTLDDMLKKFTLRPTTKI